MLGKLMKYEFKATGRLLVPLYVALMIFAIINKLFMGDMSAIDSSSTFGTFIQVTTMVIYVVIMVSIFIVTLFVIIQRYRTNLLGDEGYLMNTLPVKPWQNIMSKLLVASIWMILSVIMAMFSILILAYQKDMFSMISDMMSAFFKEAYSYIGSDVTIFSLEIILMMISGLVSSILIIYASVSIGNLFAKSKILASFGAFIGLTTVSEITTNFVFNPIRDSLESLSIESFRNTHLHYTLIFAIVASIIFSVVYFIISHYILTRKLNLE